MKRGLLERLDGGGVVCAEGYLFEMERRGYLTAGEFVPEVALENPEALMTLHRDFRHAGSDVMEAFTYNAHREKLRIIGKEALLEPLNRAALKIAQEAAADVPDTNPMTSSAFKHKLAAILSADVVGCSRLIAEDAVAAVRILKAYRDKLTIKYVKRKAWV